MRLAGRLDPAEMFPKRTLGYSILELPVAGLRVRVIEALGPGGMPALFIHGWGCSSFVWRRNLPFLAHRGVRPFAMDLPGHGLSSKPRDPARYTPDGMADVVLATMDALGLERTAVVAHSLGAVVARRVASRAPDRVSAMVLLAPVSVGRVPMVRLARAISPNWIRPIVPLLTFRWTIAAGLWLSRGGNSTLTPGEVDEYWAPTQFPEMTLAAVQMLHAFDWEPDPSAISTRTLVILAGGDRVVRAEANPAYHVIPDAGHNVQEQAEHEVNRLVLSFLSP